MSKLMKTLLAAGAGLALSQGVAGTALAANGMIVLGNANGNLSGADAAPIGAVITVTGFYQTTQAIL